MTSSAAARSTCGCPRSGCWSSLLRVRAMSNQAQIAPIERQAARRGVRRLNLMSAILLAPAVLVVLVLFVYPFIYGLVLSLLPKEGGAFANYINFFSNPRERVTIWSTLRLA